MESDVEKKIDFLEFIQDESCHPSTIPKQYPRLNGLVVPERTQPPRPPTPPLTPPPPPTNFQPISKFLRDIIHDQALPKLISIVFSILTIYFFTTAYWRAYKIPFFLVNGASLVYMVFAMVIGALEKQDTVAQNACLKKFFCGRKIYWHELHSSICAAFVASHLSTLIFLAITMYGMTITPLMLFNMAIFYYEWHEAGKIERDFVLESRDFECRCSLSKGLFALFVTYPRTFNLLRTLLVLATVVNCMWFLPGDASRIIHTFVLFFTTIIVTLGQFGHKFENNVAGECVSKKKLHTYFSISITIYFLFAYLFNVFGEDLSWWKTANRVNMILFLIGLTISYLDLYAQAIFNHSYRTGDPNMKDIIMPRNLPATISNPFTLSQKDKQSEAMGYAINSVH